MAVGFFNVLESKSHLESCSAYSLEVKVYEITEHGSSAYTSTGESLKDIPFLVLELRTLGLREVEDQKVRLCLI